MLQGCFKWMHYCWAHCRLLKRAHSPSFQRALSSPTWTRTATGRAVSPLHYWIQTKDFSEAWQASKKGDCLWALAAQHKAASLGAAGKSQGETPVVQRGWGFGSCQAPMADRRRVWWGCQTAGCRLGIPRCPLILQAQGCRECQEGCKERGEISTSSSPCIFPQAAQ